jgi:3-methyladenine DNA glycosylase/8-oxoguanine DNA glycosylase
VVEDTRDTRHSLTLPYQPPYQWQPLLAFYRQRCINGVELVGTDSYSRSFHIAGQAGYFTVAQAADGHALTVEVHGVDQNKLTLAAERIARQFDVAARPDLITRSLGQHPALRQIVGTLPGLRIPGIATEFEAVIRAIAGQQISVKAARTLLQRLCERCGEHLPAPHGPATGAPFLLFPTPAAMLNHTLEGLGFTGKRATWMRQIAETYASGFTASAGDLASSVQLLTTLPGIGEWSAHYIAMRALGEVDAFPTADLGLLNALRNPERPTAKALQAMAEQWRPWRGYATLYLWQTLG